MHSCEIGSATASVPGCLRGVTMKKEEQTCWRRWGAPPALSLMLLLLLLLAPVVSAAGVLVCLLQPLRPRLHGDVFAGIRNVLVAFAPTVYTKTAKTIWKTDVFEDGFQSGSFRKRSRIVAM